SGVERLMEDHLRGIRGQVERRRDTGQEQRIPPQPGEDVSLTIDMALQARVRALMNPAFGLTRVQPWHENEQTPLGTPLFGAAIVMEVDSGDVIAMVSTPEPDPDQTYEQLRDDPDQPLINRAVSGVYEPGSTLKPIVYLLAASQGHIGVDQRVECKGHFLEDRPGIYRCWGWRPELNRYLQHGPLDAVEAIARSCNIFFYQCGRNMGAEALVAGLREFGFGEATGLLPGEENGLMARNMSLSNAIMMGIGQGPIAVPPIQVASAHAAVARGGYWLSPVLVNEQRHKQTSREVRVSPRAIAKALEGMYDSSYEMNYGTGAGLSLPDGSREPVITMEDVVVRTKTGTAQASPQVVEDDDGERRVIRSGSHSWYVAHVQKPGEDRVAYVITVMIEYGGSGGRVSGPVVNQILYALREEGYL
ncbi:MAG: penicillin-binding transpeptidase domain-containing protein, partial [Phycisphaeraceae bacterium]